MSSLPRVHCHYRQAQSLPPIRYAFAAINIFTIQLDACFHQIKLQIRKLEKP
jgi:hypothetical protein